MNRSGIVGLIGSVALLFTHSASSAEDGCSKAYDSAIDSASFERCRALAFAGEKSAQLGYGLILWSGYDRTPNRAEALEWWRRAAHQGYLPAQVALADLLSHPELEPALRNDVEAYAWRSALGQVRQASELWKTFSPEQQQRATMLAEELKSKYVVPK
jgi:TPR repeat protein